MNAPPFPSGQSDAPGSTTVLASAVAEEATLPRFGVPAEVRDWGMEHRISERDPARAVRMLLVTAIWYLAFVVGGELLSSWWGWALVWTGLVGCMMRLDGIHHEGAHRSLFESRWANDLVASVSGAMEGFHAPAYRCFHMTHHAVTRSTGDPSDPEDFWDQTITRPARFGPVTIPARVMYVGGILVGGPVFAIQLFAGAISTLVNRPPDYVRSASLQRHVRRWGLLPFVIWGLAITLAITMDHVGELLRWWLIPMAIFLVVPYTFLVVSEHYGAPRDGQMITSTGSVESNRLYRWIVLDGNYHLAHHVFPNASWWWLADADEVLRDRTPLTYSGYLRFHAMVWREMGSSNPSTDATSP